MTATDRERAPHNSHTKGYTGTRPGATTDDTMRPAIAIYPKLGDPPTDAVYDAYTTIDIERPTDTPTPKQPLVDHHATTTTATTGTDLAPDDVN